MKYLTILYLLTATATITVNVQNESVTCSDTACMASDINALPAAVSVQGDEIIYQY